MSYVKLMCVNEIQQRNLVILSSMQIDLSYSRKEHAIVAEESKVNRDVAYRSKRPSSRIGTTFSDLCLCMVQLQWVAEKFGYGNVDFVA